MQTKFVFLLSISLTARESPALWNGFFLLDVTSCPANCTSFLIQLRRVATDVDDRLPYTNFISVLLLGAYMQPVGSAENLHENNSLTLSVRQGNWRIYSELALIQIIMF